MIGKAIALTLLLSGSAAGQAQSGLSPTESLQLIETVRPFFVTVEYTLRWDKGEPPDSSGWISRCPNCGNYHVNDSAGVVEQERPMETTGYLLADDQVITQDPVVHPRFIADIAVRRGTQRVPATIGSYCTTQNAILLKLEQPFESGRGLSFDPAAPGPYYAVTRERPEAAWTTTVRAVQSMVSVDEYGRRFTAVPSSCLIVSRQATPVGMSMASEIEVDESWKGTPLEWPAVSAEDLNTRLAQLQAACKHSVLRVLLHFRSPKTQDRQRYWHGGDEDEAASRRHAAGILCSPTTILVLCKLKPAVTARLERILVSAPGAQPVEATFVHSLKEYGGFLAKLNTPLEPPLKWSDDDIVRYRNQLLLTADIQIAGEQRITYFMHHRIRALEIGQKKRIYPEMYSDDATALLVNMAGELIALAVTPREKPALGDNWSSNDGLLTSTRYLNAAIADSATHGDPQNRPLGETEENRLAWMGIELQPLDRELARAQQVAHLTQDGESGALVSYVFADSPAEQAGVEAGFVLSRLHVESEPKPMEIQLRQLGADMGGGFNWEYFDQYPLEYFDELPKPWPSVDNQLNRVLTDLGIGRSYTAEFYTNGQALTKAFEITPAPPHYETAKEFEDEELGLSVRDLTFEVRRYFQKSADDPGVIISKVENGGKAAVAGLRPFEIISQVNDSPVGDAATLEKLITDQQELRLLVSRQAKERIVRIKLSP